MRVHVLIPLLLVIPAFPALFAQEYRGTISGAVTDPAGGAIAKAQITVTETRTGVRSTAVSDNSGAYSVPFLALGKYDISAEAPGFKKAVRSGITLSAGEHPVIDIQLEIGATTESVEVHADTPLLETANPSVGQVITTAEVEDLPVNGRTPMMLDNLALGVVSTFEPGPVRPFDNGAPNSISIGGAPASRNEVLLNGSPNAGQTNQMAYSPPQDAVTEVRVSLFDMDASFGHTMGGTVNLITKSGTNSIHGVGYIFNQTSAFDANTFFNNARGIPRPPYHQNQYGVNAGGPVYVPKLFNGKNRVFWFFAYEGMHDSDPANSPLETGNPENFATVPTAAERQGDFSALLKAGPAYTIYDPNTGVLQGTQVSRTPFPNNIIPTDRLNPVALKLLQYYPLPNTAGLINGTQNYVINAIDSDRYDNELGRADFNLSDRNKLSFDARHNYRAQDKNNFFGNPATGNFLYRINQGADVDDVYTISPTTVMDVRANWTRYIENHSSGADTVDPASLGFPGYIDQNAKFRMLPYITFNDNTSTGSANAAGVSGGARPTFEPLGYNGDANNYFDTFQAFGEVTKIHGNHTIKAGVDAREYRWSGYTFGNPSGNYFFNAAWTDNPAVSNTAAPSGQEFAAFLLGLPSLGSIDLNTQYTVQAKYLGLFVNDDFRVRSNLTLNLGLRWEHDFPESERHNRSVNGFDPTSPNPISAAAMAAYAANPNPLLPASQFHPLGGLTFVNSGSPHIYRSNSKIFSPRIGFAWTPIPGGKTAIRGGVGVLVDPIPLAAPNQQGFSQTTQMPITSNNFLSPVTTLSDPFPGGNIVPPLGAAGGLGTYLGQTLSFMNPNMRNPYAIRWELSVQRQLPGQMVLEVAYIGNHGVHLPINRQLDYIPRQYLSTSLVRDNAVNTLLTGSVANPFKGLLPNAGSLNGSTVALQQLLTPFPQYPVPPVPTPQGTTSGAFVQTNLTSGVIMQNNPAGSSYYESLNVRLQKRLTNGLTLLNNFVFNRLEDRTQYLNDSDPAPREARFARLTAAAQRAGRHLGHAHRPRAQVRSALPNPRWRTWRLGLERRLHASVRPGAHLGQLHLLRGSAAL